MGQMTKEQRELFEALHTSKLEDIKVFNRPEYRGFWNSIIDKYPEAAHFVYELLQNADDAEATEVLIKVSPQSMSFKHNGRKHFDITESGAKTPGDINAITGIGYSTKVDAQNKIGKFGVGFKAVFQYTDAPEIYDDVFKFRIEEHIVPVFIEKDHPERKEGETLFVFPFKDPEKAYEDIVKRVETLKSPILFLSNLQHIRIELRDKSNKVHTYEYSKKSEFEKDFKDEVFLNKYLLTNPQSTEVVYMFGKEIDVETEKDITIHTIYVAFYYDPEKEELITDKTQNAFCFFPTKENFNTCYVCHAPFLLTDNRQNLKPSEPVNYFLLKELALLATQAVKHLCKLGRDEKKPYIHENIVKILPDHFTSGNSKWYYEEFEKVFIDAFEDFVDEEKIFLSRNGRYLSKRNAYTGSPKELVDLLSADQLKSLTWAVESVDFLKWELIKKLEESNLIENSYSSNDFARNITPQFMAKQDLKWVSKMYTFLKESARNLWNFSPYETKRESAFKPFRKAPIIKLQTGQWVAPYINNLTPNVFIPLGNGLNKGYNFIHKDYLEDKVSENFFKELGIGGPDEMDYIRQIVVKKYSDENDDLDADVLLADMDLLLNYYVSHSEEEANALIDLLKDKILLGNKNGDLSKPNELYLEGSMLSKFLGEDDDSILDEDFYEEVINSYKRDTFIEFVTKLGVCVVPKVIKRFYGSTWGLPDRIRNQINLGEVSEWKIWNYELSDFADAVYKRKWSKELSLYIWNDVLPNLNLDGFEYLEVSYRPYRKRSFYLANRRFKSSFKDDLTFRPWLYDINNKMLSPEKIFIEDLPAEYQRNEKIINFLGIKQRERSIIELGATAEEQQSLDAGRELTKAGEGLSMEEMKAALKEAAEKKKRQEEKSTAIPVVEESQDEIEAHSSKLNEKWEKKENSACGKPRSARNNDGDFSDNIYTPSNAESDASFFEEGKHFVPEADNSESSEEQIEKKLEKKKNAAEEDAQKAKEDTLTFELLKKSKKFSYEWFKLYMEMLHAHKSNRTERQVQIDFTEKKFICDGKVLRLSNPSRPVPNWVTDADRVVISTLGDKSHKIEGTIVKSEDATVDISVLQTSELTRICNEAKKIRIVANSLSNIIDSLETRFLQLGYENDFDMDENLTQDIEFIYGPPGTGKTTTLVNRVSDILKDAKNNVNILVLTPTNKAADVVAEKMANDSVCYNYLTRFGATESLYLIEEAAVVQNRDTADLSLFDKNVVVTTAARYAYDYIQPDDTFICDVDWDYIIIDEASMVDIVTAIFILYKGMPAKFIISGDPKQISPVEEDGFDLNIYDLVKLKDFGEAINSYDRYKVTALTMQHRSTPVIGELVSKYAYNGIVRANPQRAPRKPLQLEGMAIKDINFIGFEIGDFDLVKGITEIDGSAFHLYAAIFAYNFAEYMVKQITEKYPNKPYSIGIISPYRAEADAIKQLLENRPIGNDFCQITSGTVHSFQGDECDIMFLVLNPPLHCSKKAHINKENIINVAMSRARDYLFFIMPQGQPKGMIIKRQLSDIVNAPTMTKEKAMFRCLDLEKVIFGEENYITSNTHVTCHMPVNVYHEENSVYEVKISENALDIKINKSL